MSKINLFDTKVYLIRNIFRQFFPMMLGALFASFGLTKILLTNGLLDGGTVGMALLTEKIFRGSIGLYIAIWNFPFLILGYFTIGRTFVFKSAFGVGLFILFTYIFQNHIDFTIDIHDKFLAAIFGGALLGAGSGLAMRVSAVLDGTEILAVFLSRKGAFDIGDWVLGINVIIFGIAGTVFGLPIALYSMVAYFCSSKALEYVLHGVEEYNSITIISNYPREISRQIMEQTGRGVTILQGRGGYSDEEKLIVMCVATRLEVPAIRELVNSLDEKAFILTASLNEATGGMTKKNAIKI